MHGELEFDEVCVATKGCFHLFGKTFKAISPMVMTTLFCLKNPLVGGSDEEITVADCEIFLYLCEAGKDELEEILIDPSSVVGKAMGSLEKMGITIEQFVEYHERQMKIAFLPLDGISIRGQENKEQITASTGASYDLSWVISVCSRAASTFHEAIENTMNRPLNMVCHGLVSWMSENGNLSGNGRRSTAEIEKAKLERTAEIVIDFLIAKGVLLPEERENTLDLVNGD